MQIVNDSLEKKKRKERIVEKCDSADYFLNGKRVNKNVYELQMIYESTQMKSTKILPEFVERIRFMVVNEVKKATKKKFVDQSGELFNCVLESLLSKIVPKYDSLGNLKTQYNPEKANLGTYIMRTCYWGTRNWHTNEKYHEDMTNCSDFMEDYSKVADAPRLVELGNFKFITHFDVDDPYIPLVQKLLQGDVND